VGPQKPLKSLERKNKKKKKKRAQRQYYFKDNVRSESSELQWSGRRRHDQKEVAPISERSGKKKRVETPSSTQKEGSRPRETRGVNGGYCKIDNSSKRRSNSTKRLGEAKQGEGEK